MLPPGRQLICAPCRKKIRYVSGPVCCLCGKPLRDENAEYCSSCRKERPGFVQGIAWAEYSSRYIRRFLAQVKYHNGRQLLDYPCQDFAKRISGRVKRWNAQALIPVPVHEERRRLRGYNQAEEIAVRLSRELEIPVDPCLLYRTENTEAQKDLGALKRHENLLHAFSAKRREHPYHTVILVDDIYTTGATASACTLALKRAGVRAVYVLVLAISRDI